MLNHISPFVYTAICNYVEQNELIDTLYNKGFIGDGDMYLPYFDTWITFSDIEKIIDLDILIEK